MAFRRVSMRRNNTSVLHSERVNGAESTSPLASGSMADMTTDDFVRLLSEGLPAHGARMSRCSAYGSESDIQRQLSCESILSSRTGQGDGELQSPTPTVWHKFVDVGVSIASAEARAESPYTVSNVHNAIGILSPVGAGPKARTNMGAVPWGRTNLLQLHWLDSQEVRVGMSSKPKELRSDLPCPVRKVRVPRPVPRKQLRGCKASVQVKLSDDDVVSAPSPAPYSDLGIDMDPEIRRASRPQSPVARQDLSRRPLSAGVAYGIKKRQMGSGEKARPLSACRNQAPAALRSLGAAGFTVHQKSLNVRSTGASGRLGQDVEKTDSASSCDVPTPADCVADTPELCPSTPGTTPRASRTGSKQRNHSSRISSCSDLSTFDDLGLRQCTPSDHVINPYKSARLPTQVDFQDNMAKLYDIAEWQSERQSERQSEHHSEREQIDKAQGVVGSCPVLSFDH